MKKCFCILFVFVFAYSFVFSLPVFAKGIELPGEGFYCTPEEQEEIWRKLQDDPQQVAILGEENLHLDIESIAPRYRINLLECSESGSVKMQAAGFGAKILFPDEEVAIIASIGQDRFGQYRMSGSFTLAYLERMQPESFQAGVYDQANEPASCSYADWAERIKEQLGLEEIIPERFVRLVSFYPRCQVSPLFYINDGVREGFYLDQMLWSSDDFLEFAKEYAIRYHQEEEKIAKMKETWEVEHPGETFMISGGMGISFDWNFQGVMLQPTNQSQSNILHIREYFSENVNENFDSMSTPQAVVSPEPEKSRVWIFVSVGAAAVILAGSVWIAVKKRKKKPSDPA